MKNDMRRFGFWIAVMSFGALTARGTTFSVTSLTDTVTSGTLRWAITAANTSPAAPHIISFNVPSPFIIAATGNLPDVTSPGLLINGASQPGYSSTPIVHLKGALTGLRIATSNVTVRALRISGFSAPANSGILIMGVSNRVIASAIQSNHFGIHMTGLSRANVIGGNVASNGNLITHNDTGIRADGGGFGHQVAANQMLVNRNGLYWQAHNSTIGGTATNFRNIISGSISNGIFLVGRDNQIKGNFIGTDATGTNANPNRIGLYLLSASNNVIGEASDGRNIISGNGSLGILVENAVGNEFVGNYVGLRVNGLALGNGGSTLPWGGILFESGTSNILLNNVVSGNRLHGIALMSGAAHNGLYGNLIGVYPTGLSAISNSMSGVFISNAFSTVIGSAASPIFRNVISGNGQHGIHIIGTNTGTTIIGNNFIGITVSGGFSLFNSGSGIFIENAQDVEIGSIADGPVGGNLISANAGAGILIAGTNARNIRIQHNFIGSDITGTNFIGNVLSGVRILNGGTNIAIGVNGRNLISGNQEQGVQVSGAGVVTIANNYIGVATNGVTALRNTQNGVFMSGAIGRAIITNNVISGNFYNGVRVEGPLVSNVLIAANRIGVNAAGTAILSNRWNGISLFNSGSLVVGGVNASARNVISGNDGNGIYIENATNAQTTISGNSIGVNVAGNVILSNRHNGIYINICQPANSAHYIIIGGPFTNYANFISGNQSNGVLSLFSDLVAIVNNRIGTDNNGSAFLGNRAAGIYFQYTCVSNVVLNNVIANNGGPGIWMNDGSRNAIIQGNRIGLGNGPLVNRGNQGPGILAYASENILYGDAVNPFGFGNAIAYNQGPGIAVTSVPFAVYRLRHEMYGNRIYNNTGIPIDLHYDGVTTNDPAPDADIGLSNNFQNFPVLATARRGSDSFVYGQLVSAPNRNYRIEYLATDPALGMRFVGYTNVFLGASGTGTFAHSFMTFIATGATVFATASTTNEGTSEFSAGVLFRENLTDTDNDKMPDWWEIVHGFNQAVSNAPGANADGDAYTDLEEWISFTDPRDPLSYPRISAIASAADDRLVTFPSSHERVYRLSRTEELATSPTWTAVGGLVTGLVEETTITDTNPPSFHTYHVDIRLP